MKTAITLTTIHKPVVLESYLKNLQQFGHKDVSFVVVGDHKTPAEVKSYCEALSNQFSVKIHYLDVPFQQEYLKRFPELDKHIPYNSFSRRNIGDLFAYEEGFECIIRVDDDNFPTEDDFITGHHIVGSKQELQVVSSKTGWFNICKTLQDKDNIPFYPRGFLYSKRWQDEQETAVKKSVNVVLNAGLWLGDPDVDAVTRLCKPIDAVQFNETFGAHFALEKGIQCPVNTQNTSYARKIMPAAFVPPNVGRYDDIWSGYLLRKVMDHLGDSVSFGRPLLKQFRNVHNLWKDLEFELNGNINTPHLFDVMDSITLTKSTYAECYYELSEALTGQITENKDVFLKVFEGMRIWVETLSKVSR